MPTPDDFDFPCSQTWREYYNWRFGDDNMIDFACSPDWQRHYQSIGVMPGYPERPPDREPRGKRPSMRDWQQIGQVLAKAQPPQEKETARVRGVLR